MLAHGQGSRAPPQAPILLHRQKEFPGSKGAKELPVTVQSSYQQAESADSAEASSREVQGKA